MNCRVVGGLTVLMAVGGVLLLLLTGGCGGDRTASVSGSDMDVPDGPDILLMDDEGLVPEEKLAALSEADGDKDPDVIIEDPPLTVGWGYGDVNYETVDVGQRLARRFWTKPNFIYTVELWGQDNSYDDPDLTLNRQVNGKWRRSALTSSYVDTLMFKSTQRAWMWVKIYGYDAYIGTACHAYLRIGHRDMLNLTPPEWAG